MKIILVKQSSGRYYYNGCDITKYDNFSVQTFKRPAHKCILKEKQDEGYKRCYYFQNWSEGYWNKDWSDALLEDDRIVVTRAAFFK